MWLKKMKKKKVQFFLISLILCFATTIFAACVSFTVEMNVYTEKCFSYDKCPIGFAVISGKVDKSIATGGKSAAYIGDVEESRAMIAEETLYSTENEPIFGGTPRFFYEMKDINGLKYNMGVIQTLSDEDAPADGEIWVCTVFMEANESLSLGDKMKLGKDGEELTISRIISTPACPVGFMDLYPFFVNGATLERVNGVEVTALSIYANSADVTQTDVLDNMSDEFNERLISCVKKSSMRLCTSIMPSIFGGVGIIAAIVIFSLAVVIIGFIIKSTLAREFRAIGIYKACGWKNRQIIGFYFKSYIFSGVLGILLGAALSVPLGYYLNTLVTHSLGIFEFSAATPILTAASSFLLLLVLIVSIYAMLGKIGKITPIEALNSGTSSSKDKLNKSLIKNAASALSMAINDIFRRKSASFILILVLFVSFYQGVLFFSIFTTLGNYNVDKEVWQNMPAFDATIAIADGELDDVSDYIENNEDIEKFVYANLDAPLTNICSKTCPDTDISPLSLLVYSEISESLTDTYLNEGRIPSNPNEVSLSTNVRGILGAKVGDYINFTNGENSEDYLVTGVYSTMLQGGDNFTLSKENYEKLGYTFVPKYALLFFNDTADFETVKADFLELGLNSDFLKNFDMVKMEGKTINNVSTPISFVMIIVFMLFCVVNIVNLMLTTNRENRKKYGILKAMGFTNGYICRQNIAKITVLSFVALILSFIAHKFVSPILFSLACGVCYIVETPLVDIIIEAAIFALILFTTLMFTIPLRKISPKDLMEE